MPHTVTLALGRWRQGDHEFTAIGDPVSNDKHTKKPTPNRGSSETGWVNRTRGGSLEGVERKRIIDFPFIEHL